MASSAIVARSTTDGLSYLKDGRSGSGWVAQTREADVFMSMREATRAAMVLPAHLRAFALPLSLHA